MTLATVQELVTATRTRLRDAYGDAIGRRVPELGDARAGARHRGGDPEHAAHGRARRRAAG